MAETPPPTNTPGERKGDAQNPPDPPKPPATAFNEYFTASLAGVITLVAMGVLIAAAKISLDNIKESSVPGFERLKDILSIAVGIFGTVLGYYFGRVPAEKRADTADKRADAAQTQAADTTKQAQKTKDDTKVKLDGIIQKLAATGGSPAQLNAQPQLNAGSQDEVQRLLRELRDSLS